MVSVTVSTYPPPGIARTAHLEAAAVGRARELMNHWLARRRTVGTMAELWRGLQKRDALGREPLGKHVVVGARTHHGVRQPEQAGEPLVPPLEAAIGGERADALADAVERRAHLVRHGALLGLGCHQLVARPRQKACAQREQHDRQAGTAEREKRGRCSRRDRPVVAAHPRRCSSSARISARIASIWPMRRCPTSVCTRASAASNPLSLRSRMVCDSSVCLRRSSGARASRRTCWFGLLAVRPSQFDAELDGAREGIAVGRQVVRPAGEQVAALAGFRGVHGDPQLVDGGDDLVRVADHEIAPARCW